MFLPFFSLSLSISIRLHRYHFLRNISHAAQDLRAKPDIDKVPYLSISLSHYILCLLYTHSLTRLQEEEEAKVHVLFLYLCVCVCGVCARATLLTPQQVIVIDSGSGSTKAGFAGDGLSSFNPLLVLALARNYLCL
jgi:hypothetical protein